MSAVGLGMGQPHSLLGKKEVWLTKGRKKQMPSTVDIVLGKTFNYFCLNWPMQKGTIIVHSSSNDSVYSQVLDQRVAPISSIQLL